MKTLSYPFILIAGAGFLLSLSAHLMALAGKTLPGGGLVWGLHIGIFVVWIPAILIGKRQDRGVQRKDSWDATFAACPIWMRRALKLVFAYAIVNFILFLVGTSGHPKPKGTAPPAVIRGFSGHWMVFYGAAFVTFYSAIKAPHLRREGLGPEGHELEDSRSRKLISDAEYETKRQKILNEL